MKRSLGLLLIVLSTAVFLPSLLYIDIISGHEAREGVRLREMLGTGHWFVSEVLRKPPLYYWMSGAIAQLRGGTLDALSLRMPSALLAGLGVLVVFWLGRYPATLKGGAWGGVILLTSLLYVQQGHNSRTDMALCFFVTVSLLLFFFAYTQFWRHGRGGGWLPYLFACSLALALLSKGPVGIILALLPIICFLIWCRDLSGAWPVLRPGPLLTFAVLGGGWYLYALWEGGAEFWHTQIMEENVARFAGGIDKMSFFYYLGPFLFKFAPWNLFLPVALWRACKEKQEGPVFLALWWVTIMLFFQLSAYKRARYLLPAQPASSLLVGWWCATQLSAAAVTVRGWKWRKHGLALLSVVIMLAAASGLLALWGTWEKGPVSCSQVFSFAARETQEQVVLYCHWLARHFWAGAVWWSLMALCFFFFLRFLVQVQLERALVSLSLALLLVYSAFYPSWLSVTSWAESPQGYVNNIVEKIGPGGQVAFIDPCADQGFTVLFALQERAQVTAVQWPWETPSPPVLPTGYYLISDDRRAEVTSRSPGTWFEVVRDTSSLGWPLALFFYQAS